jgi:DinB superfamily
MDAVFLLQHLAKSAHQWLEQTVGDVTPEQVHWAPENGVNLGAHYAHIVVGEDVLINGIARGGAEMAGASLEGKTGLSEPMPQGAFDEWAKRVQIDMPALRAYGAAVFANTEAYIASLTPEDLDREIDLASWGMDKVPLGVFIGAFAIANTNWHCGEISTLKGLQGLKGYPA